MTIIWNQCQFSNYCLKVAALILKGEGKKKKEKGNNIFPSKAEKSNSITRIKIKLLGNFLQFIEKRQEEEFRGTGKGIW